MRPRQLVKAPRKAKESKQVKAPAKSEADWIAQEQQELSQEPIKPQGDLINEAVNRTTYAVNAGRREWRGGKPSKPFTVTRLYFHAPAIIIDKPGSMDEAKMKAEFFAQTEISYVAIEPGEGLTVEDLSKRVQKAVQATKRLSAQAA